MTEGSRDQVTWTICHNWEKEEERVIDNDGGEEGEKRGGMQEGEGKRRGQEGRKGIGTRVFNG